MNGLDLFRKIGRGAKFNLKRFQTDAEKLNIVTKQPKDTEKKRSLDFFAKSNSSDQEEEEDDPEPKEKRLKLTDDDAAYDDDDDNDDDEQEESEEEMSDEDELEILGNIKSTKTEKKVKKSGRMKMTPQEKSALIKQEKVNRCRNQNRIHVYGADIPDPITSFDQLQANYNLHPKIIENIKSVGYKEPTPIQMQAIPVMMMNREILACAPTGSGKTAAFLIPIIHHLKEPRNVGFRALLLAPTRELAQQTYRECCRLAEGRGLRVHFIEKATESTIKKLSSKAGLKLDILVTTPNRLVYLIKQEPPAVRLNKVEWLIVDESDKLFEEGKTGFRDQLADIYKACDSTNVRRGMFSATFAYDVEQWCKLNLDNLVSVHIGARNSATKTIEQELLFVGSESGKMLAVRDIIRNGLTPPVLIFVQSKDRAKELFHELIYDGINVDVIHADRTQQQRENVIKCFRSGSIWVLICTDLMGRGIDFKGVNLVINYDFPITAISYIHRIGRTGRAGRKGKAITFFTEEDTLNLRSIANVMKGAGCPIPEYMLKLKRPSKDTRKQLEKNVPVRKEITTVPLADRQKMNYKRACIKRTKKKQLKQSSHAAKEEKGKKKKKPTQKHSLVET